MQRSLPEMNETIIQKKKLPYRFYALHRGGEHEKARKIVDGKDVKGRGWALEFVWSSKEFEKQFIEVKGLPSYYVLDPDGCVRAIIKGHTKRTLETLAWLVGEIEKR